MKKTNRKPNRMLWEQVQASSNVCPLFMSVSYAEHLFHNLIRLCFGYLEDMESPNWSRYCSLPYREDFSLMVTKMSVLIVADTRMSLFQEYYEAWREVLDRVCAFDIVGDDRITGLCSSLRRALPDWKSAKTTLGNESLKKVLLLQMGRYLLASGESNPTLYLAQSDLLNQIDLKGANAETYQGLVVPASFDWHTDKVPEPIDEYAYERDPQQVAVEKIWAPERLAMLRTAGRQVLDLISQTLDVFDKKVQVEVSEPGISQPIPPMKATPVAEPMVETEPATI